MVKQRWFNQRKVKIHEFMYCREIYSNKHEINTVFVHYVYFFNQRQQCLLLQLRVLFLIRLWYKYCVGRGGGGGGLYPKFKKMFQVQPTNPY